MAGNSVEIAGSVDRRVFYEVALVLLGDEVFAGEEFVVHEVLLAGAAVTGGGGDDDARLGDATLLDRHGETFGDGVLADAGGAGDQEEDRTTA